MKDHAHYIIPTIQRHTQRVVEILGKVRKTSRIGVRERDRPRGIFAQFLFMTTRGDLHLCLIKESVCCLLAHSANGSQELNATSSPEEVLDVVVVSCQVFPVSVSIKKVNLAASPEVKI